MKKAFLLLSSVLLLSACTALNSKKTTTEAPPASPTVVETLPTATLSPDVYNLVVTDSSFGTDEIIVSQGELLTLGVRNQNPDPITIVISELGVRSEEIEFGEYVEIVVPTDKPGEYEMYSGLGKQRFEGFVADLIIEEPSEALEE